MTALQNSTKRSDSPFTLGKLLSLAGIVLFAGCLALLCLVREGGTVRQPACWQVVGGLVTAGWFLRRWEAGLPPFDARRVRLLKRAFAALTSFKFPGVLLFGGFVVVLCAALFLLMLMFAAALVSLHP